ncbi:MAG: polyketide synthase, partial [Chloroflexi bacterium]
LGAMRDQFPALPQLKAEDLAELRTLQEIVDYMGNVDLNGHASPKAEASVSTGHTTLAQIDHDIPRSPAMLKYLPMPDEIEITLPTGSVCLITDDGTDLTLEVIEKLTARGWQVAVLKLPGINRSLPANVKQHTLADMSEASLQATLAQVGDVAVFIHINPPSQSGLFAQRDKDLVKLVFLIAKHLKKPLTEGAGFRAFFTVARLDGAFGMTWGDYGAIPGGLFGLAKTLNLEWANVFCRGVDLAIDMPDSQAADYLVGELHDPNRLFAEVGYTNEARYTLTAPEAAATI